MISMGGVRSSIDMHTLFLLFSLFSYIINSYFTLFSALSFWVITISFISPRFPLSPLYCSYYIIKDYYFNTRLSLPRLSFTV